MGLSDFFKRNKTVLDEELSKEVQDVRDAHKEALRQRLIEYHLTDEEIDKLFLIFKKAEEKIQKLQIDMDYKKAKEADLIELQQEIEEIQNNMKIEFQENLDKLLKEKYELAKKVLDEIRNNKKQS